MTFSTSAKTRSRSCAEPLRIPSAKQERRWFEKMSRMRRFTSPCTARTCWRIEIQYSPRSSISITLSRCERALRAKDRGVEAGILVHHHARAAAVPVTQPAHHDADFFGLDANDVLGKGGEFFALGKSERLACHFDGTHVMHDHAV